MVGTARCSGVEPVHLCVKIVRGAYFTRKARLAELLGGCHRITAATLTLTLATPVAPPSSWSAAATQARL
jgi:hypothetical protein